MEGSALRERLKSRNGRNVQIGSVEYASGHTLTVPLDRGNVLWERSKYQLDNVLTQENVPMERSSGPIRRDPMANLGLCSCCAHTYTRVARTRILASHTDYNKMTARVGGEQ